MVKNTSYATCLGILGKGEWGVGVGGKRMGGTVGRDIGARDSGSRTHGVSVVLRHWTENIISRRWSIGRIFTGTESRF